jgi:hypothetical protein
MKIKPWQLAVIVLGLVVGIGAFVYMYATTEEINIARVMYLVDVENGDLYKVNLDGYIPVVPARHPDTGKIQLVRVQKDDSGGWFMTQRDMVMLGALDKDVKNTVVDPESGKLTVKPKGPTTYHKPSHY